MASPYAALLQEMSSSCSSISLLSSSSLALQARPSQHLHYRAFSSSSKRSPPLLQARASQQADPQKNPEQDDQKNTVPSKQASTGTNASSEIRKTPQKASTSFFDVFAFSGPAPETINGRLAMLGFVAAIGTEAATGHGLLAQVREDGGVQWFALCGLLISAASLVPIFKGLSKDSQSGAIMSAKAETWNGRVAMLGFVALALTEYFKQGPLMY